MGGPGSGNWYRWQSPKQTVESCRSIDSAEWARDGVILAGETVRGRRVWYKDLSRKREESSIGYLVQATESGTGSAEISYAIGKGERRESLEYVVRLQTTQPNFGGLRWWFTCPLIIDGRPCRRRVRKLYLSGRFFGCRQCHDLTYRSCQESHKVERLRQGVAKLLARTPGISLDQLTPAEVMLLSEEAFLDEDEFL